MSTIATAPTVTVIPAKTNLPVEPVSGMPILRVAAYCRVSTGEEEQLNSYATQVKYYTDYITSNPNWELVGIFADEGISGTGTAKRTEFNKMIKTARKHKIDMILCKSISRFARNTVDCLKHVRELRDLGVNVKFEKENIETISASSEFQITLYASFAQAESESISKNVTWGIEKAFQSGKVRYQMRNTLGYRLEDGKPVIVEEEAEIVRQIFKMFAEGQSMGKIANYLTEREAPRRNGEKVWNRANVNLILRNEKYVGDAILQKTYTSDCLTHSRKVNNGKKRKYFLRDCHPAIIDRDTWDRVHLELARRSAEMKGRHPGKKYVKQYCLSDILTCPICGGKYKRTIWRSGGKKYGVWRCSTRMEGVRSRCKNSPSFHEDKLHIAILTIVNDMIGDPERVETAIMSTLDKYRTEIAEIDQKIADTNAEIEQIGKRRDEILEIITGAAFEQFKTELRNMNGQELAAKHSLEQLQIRKEGVQLRIKKAVTARELFANMAPQAEFDETLIPKLIERIDVVDKGSIRVVFRGGLEVEGTVEK